MEIRKLEQRIRRQPEWKQKIIRAALAAIPKVSNEYDRETILPGGIHSLLGPEKTMRGSTVYSAVEKIGMILSRERSSEAVEACRLAREAMGRK